MDDIRVGSAFRAVRLRRRWRQEDVATRAGVARSAISDLERGHFSSMPLHTVRRIASVLDIRVDLITRWRGGEVSRMLSARHSALHESAARHFEGLVDWRVRPEVSFSIYGERGIIDMVAYHAGSGALLVIELKTEIVDVNELVGTLDRKARLAPQIAAEAQA
jgi:transcriptional regulator with XRE-family HTH domain